MIKKEDINLTENLNEATTEIEKFAKKVFDKIIEENIYPIPYYYSIYFFNMLEDESKEFKQSVMELIELEGTNELEEDLKFEQKLKTSFKYSKEIIKETAMIYKLVSLFKEKNKVFLKEIENVSTPQVFKNILRNTQKNTEAINNKIALSISSIKDLYSKNITTLKEIEKETIFDSLYGLYNNNYFIRELEKEISQIKKFKHTSSLIIIKPTDSVLNKLNSEKSKIVINRFVAKIMLKTSRRTDTIAHLGNGFFGMLLKHTDKIGAMRTSERLSDIISNSTMFIEGEELEVNISIGITEIFADKKGIDLMDCAYKKLSEAEKEGSLYKICEEG
jgi:diguanylate cyclase (GGDEF)-like protein